ncbi:helix-turn-helix transcriptional regulator [Arsenophonus nasoniae]|uniref:Helix-turn-helix transcriptional regulator n=1 Tax=Arsenophonus nasoniae TaxID=638 RepID=A0AA95GP13_9GAMM|nr:helix-turn-helix transcriptional regulator [Arsenophonus nasoniae]WGM00044.1 helix-turn-helix transcriptional regulator [Arsenophonus nasoniae]
MNNIKKLRKKIDMSQIAFAKVLGLSQGAVAHYEKGRRSPNVDMAKKILSAFNNRGVYCTFEDVFGTSIHNIFNKHPKAK